MIREIDLVSYLPPFMADFKEIAAALEAENPEFKLVWNAADQVLKNEFVETADEYGITRFEKMLNILPYNTDTLEDRRLRVLTMYNANTVCTQKVLENMLDSLCGKGKWKYNLSAQTFTVSIKVALESISQKNCIEDFLKQLLPCNLIYDISLIFTLWRHTKPFRWKEMSAFTWDQLEGGAPI